MRAAIVGVLAFALALARPAAAAPAPAPANAEEQDEALPPLPAPASAEPPAPEPDAPIASTMMRPWLPGAEAGAAASLFPASLRPPPPPSSSSSSRTPVVMNGGSRYGALSAGQCEAELTRRRLPVERVGETRGVLAPVRLTGPLGRGGGGAGVSFHSMLPERQRATSPYEIVDCRLVLALDDFARILARYDVVEVVHYSMYRPPGKREPLNGPGGAGRRHSGALAIDAARFKTRDGRVLDVEKDFHGRIGNKTCGVSDAGLSTNAVTLRRFVCEAADARIFNVLLTPDYNWPHRNHFHLEVTAGVRWILVR